MFYSLPERINNIVDRMCLCLCVCVFLCVYVSGCLYVHVCAVGYAVGV